MPAEWEAWEAAQVKPVSGLFSKVVNIFLDKRGNKGSECVSSCLVFRKQQPPLGSRPQKEQSVLLMDTKACRPFSLVQFFCLWVRIVSFRLRTLLSLSRVCLPTP